MSDNLEQRIRNKAEENFSLGTITAFASDLVELIDQYKNMLKKVEWLMDDQWEEEFCPVCLGWKKNGHEEDCELERLLKSQ